MTPNSKFRTLDFDLFLGAKIYAGLTLNNISSDFEITDQTRTRGQTHASQCVHTNFILKMKDRTKKLLEKDV